MKIVKFPHKKNNNIDFNHVMVFSPTQGCRYRPTVCISKSIFNFYHILLSNAQPRDHLAKHLHNGKKDAFNLIYF